MTFNVSHLFVVASVLLVATVANAQVHTGTLFWFIPELGACGFTNTSRQLVASVSSTFFNTFPGATPNPNNNPICTRKLLITSGAKNVTASIVDLFVEDAPFDVGLSPAGFVTFAPLDDGIVPNVFWSVV
ncbi:hypothetical protein Hypma_012246 [Hypsizygus marmoreus]|uniref:Uncharacterized protein n=1 Tax=Hypsizygus marmoreus TaxID=39966 RepID=A0A369JEU4_HYPMA|nr:hypothetical protein Hypma_012246 [Hypsizygus marmoreus]